MNNYATIAQQNWQTLAPSTLKKMSQEMNLQQHFQELGNRAEQMIQELTLSYAGADPEQESYLNKVGRLTAAQAQAREYVIANELTPPQELWEQPQNELSTNEQNLQEIQHQHNQQQTETFFQIDPASQALMSEEEKELAQYNYQQYLLHQKSSSTHL